MSPTRRRLLAIGSIATLSAAAGCLAEGPALGAGGDDEEGDGDETDGEDDGYVLRDYETVAYPATEGETDAEALFSAEDVDDAVDLDSLSDDEREAVEAFVDETDFDESVIVRVAVRVPDRCHVVELEEVDAVEDRLAIGARAVDEGEGKMCAQAEYVPTVLVRAVFDGEVPRSGSVDITDADGDDVEVDYGDGSE